MWVLHWGSHLLERKMRRDGEILGSKMVVNSTSVPRLLFVWPMSEQPFQSIVGLKTLGDPWAMLWGILWLFLAWQLLRFTSTIGLFGLCTGLLRGPCSGHSLFLAMTGKWDAVLFGEFISCLSVENWNACPFICCRQRKLQYFCFKYVSSTWSKYSV